MKSTAHAQLSRNELKKYTVNLNKYIISETGLFAILFSVFIVAKRYDSIGYGSGLRNPDFRYRSRILLYYIKC
jgi:heme/copper-type cytochrome/quinol oxidase subunit 3